MTTVLTVKGRFTMTTRIVIGCAPAAEKLEERLKGLGYMVKSRTTNEKVERDDDERNRATALIAMFEGH